eukprot:TRINITY_DN10973_c0_g1_i1.p1 TRINITY_DN10973_c0_g1~~TRINITY_DN10973_c0_g1_i1.p1  ORF type:complete len:246 (+),score=103.29 TRINITY_DN10973_c0_g1_i1:71-808(+)
MTSISKKDDDEGLPQREPRRRRPREEKKLASSESSTCACTSVSLSSASSSSSSSTSSTCSSSSSLSSSSSSSSSASLSSLSSSSASSRSSSSSSSTSSKRLKREKQYEYLDHTADIQLHSWGKDMQEAFVQIVIAMMGYLTDLDTVSVDDQYTFEIEASGHDMESLLYSFMDEFLYHFNAEYIICKDLEIISFDPINFKVKAKGYGEPFDLEKHPQGTEIKAITYSAMQIHIKKDRIDLFVVVDI